MNLSEPTFLLHVDFDAQVARTPDAVAVTQGSASASYADLRREMERLAGVLGLRGIGRGSFVGLHVERSIPHVVCVLAILRVGAAVVPLPPTFPRGRLAEILNFSSLHAVIDDDATPLETSFGVPIVHFADQQAGNGEPAIAARCDPDDAAFVLCSSGSTGNPKMIVRSHRSFYHRLRWTWTQHPYQSGERCCQKSTMSTTHAIYELFEPLLRGVPLVVIPDHVTKDLDEFWGIVRSECVSRLLLVPSALQVSLDLPGFRAPPLEVLILMGEYVHPKLAGKVIAAFGPRMRMYSIYGSTEASSTLVCDLHSEYRPNCELPLGRPISSDIRASVRDSNLAPVRDGEIGRLYVGGTALMSEYFRDAALTESVFVRSPDTGEQLYDTRDQVRRFEDGRLEFVGRTDHTVKVRGFRVDLQEVERALQMHPEVRQAAVVLNNADSASAALLGFIAPDRVDQAELYGLLRDRLPEYMIPSALVGVGDIPLTASGKSDRRKLIEDYQRRTTDQAEEPGLSETERVIREAWRSLLGHGNVRADSSFFEVGGTSLTAFAAIHRIREAFGLTTAQLSDQSIYHANNLRELAGLVDSVISGAQTLAHADTGPLVRLRKGLDAASPPLFLIASAGGTLGAYERLAAVLGDGRDVIGVRDPYIWGERDPTMGFNGWISMYIDAIRKRQPEGPYHIVAYSSAGAFGYEVARRLRGQGQEVALLALIDPFGLDCSTPGSFGNRITQARYRGRHFKLAMRVAGLWRGVFRGRDDNADSPIELPLTLEEISRRIDKSKRRLGDVVGFSALLELNTGVPFGLKSADFDGVHPEEYFPRFVAHITKVAPEVDAAMIERVFCQYYALQVPAQQNYRLRRYDGRVLLVEPDGVNRGLVKAQLGRHVRNLKTRFLRLGNQNADAIRRAKLLSAGLRDHFLCMRDDTFVAALAAELRTFFAVGRR